MRHQKGEWAGRPVDLDDWQKKILRDVFGWKRVEDDTRRYRTLYMEIPRKNGKSLLAAGLALYLLLCDGEPGAEVYSAAAVRAQALIVFDVAAQMVDMEPALSGRTEMAKSTKTMTVAQTMSKYKALSADAYTKDGLNAHGIIFDELHAQKKRDLYDVLRTSKGSRRQPLEIYITTAGSDLNSICWEVHDYALKVKEGLLPEEESFYGVIFAADKNDDWTDPKVWMKANPGFGVSIKPSFLAEECVKAQSSPASTNTFKRLYLNIWTEAADAWMATAKWNRCKRDYARDASLGKTIWLAGDLSKRIDLTALAWVWWEENKLRSQVRSYMPREVAKEREAADRTPYRSWAEQGWLTLTDGDVIDVDRIYDEVTGLSATHDVRRIGFDPWNSQSLTAKLLADEAPVIDVRQGYKTMSPFMKDTEELILNTKLHHNNNPVLNHAMASVVALTDPAGNIKPDKSKLNRRIDPAVALIMAVGMAVSEFEGESVYEDRGVIVL